MENDAYEVGEKFKDKAGNGYEIVSTRATKQHSTNRDSTVLVRRHDGVERWVDPKNIEITRAE